jgi:hypothetical protein
MRNVELNIESLRSVFFKIDRIPYFDIQYSIFAFSEFLFRLNWPLFRSAAALTPETSPLYLPSRSFALSLTPCALRLLA